MRQEKIFSPINITHLCAPHFIYFSKRSPVLLHRSHTDADCICKWCVSGEKNTFLKGFLSALESKDHFLLSYLRSVDRIVDQSSTSDNIQDVKSIEDDEHRCDQVHNTPCLNLYMKQVQNKSPRETHKCQCY